VKRLSRHLRHAIGSLLLLATVQVFVETIALAWVYNGQIMPPYDFYPTQLYDFLAKLRFEFADWLVWMPPLPSSFLPTATVHHVAVFAQLFPADIAMAALVGTAGGLLWAIVAHKREPDTRAYVLGWILLGLVVHIALVLPPLELGNDASWKNIVYRLRSIIVDGTAVAAVVFIVSSVLTLAIIPRFAAKHRRRLTTVLSLLVVATAAVLTTVPTSPDTSAATAIARAPAEGEHGQYNILLISIDSLRADHVGCYGYERDTTPAMDTVASQGIRFANAMATSSWTLPTHLTMFTGRYQIAHGVMHESFALAETVPTMGEVMKAAGYSTAGFVSAPYVAAHYGYARGMDVYRDLSSEYAHRREARSAIVSKELTDLAVDWLEEHKDEPFFMFVHNFDAHYDYTPPAPYDTMFDEDYDGDMDGTHFIERKDVNPNMDKRDLEHILALYDGEIRYTDDHIAILLAKLEQLQLDSNTVVLIVSDHGDEFFEHGNKGHHRTLYDEVMRIPMIIRLPDRAHAGTVVDEQVTLTDLMPTMLELVGVEAPDGMQGISTVPLMAGRRSGRSAIYSAFLDKRGFNLQVGRRTSESKVIQHFNRITHPRQPPIERYDVEADPGERSNIAATTQVRTRGELDILAGFLEEQWVENRRIDALADGSNRVDIDDDTMEALKALGYVD
jgi:arylsulfatase A-like enzyme